jgi:uncharacterized DUF497 family protein
MPSCGARCRASNPDGEVAMPSVGQIEKKTQERLLAISSRKANAREVRIYEQETQDSSG